jgi:hypothetical protein
MILGDRALPFWRHSEINPAGKRTIETLLELSLNGIWAIEPVN